MFPLTESFVDLMKVLLILCGLFGLMIAVNATTLLFKTRSARRYLLKKRNIAIALVAVLVMFFVLWRAWNAVPLVSEVFQRVVFGTITVALFSGLLFILKMTELRRYAILELVFGIVTCVTTLYGLNNSESPLKLVGIGTAVYLLVRGMDNLVKDIDERQAEATVDALSKKVRIAGP